jgi:hypothetical protein
MRTLNDADLSLLASQSEAEGETLFADVQYNHGLRSALLLDNDYAIPRGMHLLIVGRRNYRKEKHREYTQRIAKLRKAR